MCIRDRRDAVRQRGRGALSRRRTFAPASRVIRCLASQPVRVKMCENRMTREFSMKNLTADELHAQADQQRREVVELGLHDAEDLVYGIDVYKRQELAMATLATWPVITTAATGTTWR